MATKKSAPAKKTAPAKKSAPAKKGNPQASKSLNPDVATGLRELFIDELKDIYWAEKALTKAIPKMVKKATNASLKSALQDHLATTQTQVQRLEQVFNSIGVKAQAKKCEATAGLVKEAEEIMATTLTGPVRDAGIISAAQKIEHYEIASYGTLCVFAKTLGEEEAGRLLGETLGEEKEADELLTQIAESSINEDAMDEDAEEEDN